MGKLFLQKISVVKQHLALMIRVDVYRMLVPSLSFPMWGMAPLLRSSLIKKKKKNKTLLYNHYDEMSL